MEDIHTRLNPEVANQLVNNPDYNFQEFVDFLIHNVGEYYFINEGIDPDDTIANVEADIGLDNLNDLGFGDRINVLNDLRDNIQALDEDNNPDIAHLFVNTGLLDQLIDVAINQEVEQEQQEEALQHGLIFPPTPPHTPPPFMEGNGYSGSAEPLLQFLSEMLQRQGIQVNNNVLNGMIEDLRNEGRNRQQIIREILDALQAVDLRLLNRPVPPFPQREGNGGGERRYTNLSPYRIFH